MTNNKNVTENINNINVTENLTNKNLTNKNVTENVTNNVTNNVTENVTTENVTTENVTNENVTNENVTNENVTTENVTNENVTNENVTTENVTNENVTNENVTNENVTNENVTTENVTNENVTNNNNVTENVTDNKTEKDYYKEKYLRTLAEFENYKKRNENENKKIYKNYKGKIINYILPILDDFERYIKEEKITKKNGIYFIYKKFISILENYGLKKIDVKIGDKFNYDIHNAISQIKVNNKKMKNKIVKILEKGYYISDKIIRCAKVIVGN